MGAYYGGSSELTIAPRRQFLEAAKQELIAFEKKEREFRKSLRKERAKRAAIS